MALLPFRTSNFAQRIYLTQPDPTTFANVPEEYVDAVKQYAADKYYIDDIARAVTWGKITQAEYDETIGLKGPEDPQYRPLDVLSVPASTEII